MDQNHNAVGLYLYFVMAITMVSANVQGTEGESINITCSVAGTLPRWTKDITETLTLEGNTMINSAYSARFSYASDQKTLVVSSVQIGDAGRYVCSIGGIQGTTDVVISVLTTTTTTSPTTSSTTTSSTTTSSTTTSSTTTSTASTASTTTTSPQAPPAKSPSTPRSAEEKGFTKTIMIIVIICSCAAAAIVVFIVLLVIRRWKHQNEKSPNEMVDFEGQDVNSLN